MSLNRTILALRAFARRGTVGFNRFELTILERIAEALDANSAQRLRSRISRINLVQRIDQGRESNAYQLRRGKPVFDSDTRIVKTDDETLLASFSGLVKGKVPFTGSVWLVNGTLFSIEFDNVTDNLKKEVENLDVKIQILPSTR